MNDYIYIICCPEISIDILIAMLETEKYINIPIKSNTRVRNATSEVGLLSYYGITWRCNIVP